MASLCQAALAARASGPQPLGLELPQVIAKLSEAPQPFPVIGAFLKSIAMCEPAPPVPDGLPEPIATLLRDCAAKAKE